MNERIFEGRLAGELAPDDRERRERLKAVARMLARAVRDGLERDGQVRIHAFGTFHLKPVAARTGRHPRTGERIRIPGSWRVMFRPAKALRERVDPDPARAVPIAEPHASREAMLGGHGVGEAADAPATDTGPDASSPPPRAAAAAMPERVESISGPVPPASPAPALATAGTATAAAANDGSGTATRGGNTASSAAESGDAPRAAEHEGAHEPGPDRRPWIVLALLLLLALLLWWAWPAPAPEAPVAEAPQDEAAATGEAASGTAGAGTGDADEAGAGASAMDTAAADGAEGTAGAGAAGGVDARLAVPDPAAGGGAPGEAAPDAAAEGTATAGAPETMAGASDQAPAVAAAEGTATARAAETMSGAAEQAPAAAGEGGSGPWFAGGAYRVQRGDTLWGLADRHYVNPYYWPHIWNHNAALANPNRLEIEQRLQLPALQSAPRQLSPADRQSIARGYLRLYRFRIRQGAGNARFALVGARFFDASVVPTELRQAGGPPAARTRLAVFRERLRSGFPERGTD